jgi:hypothetical protein
MSARRAVPAIVILFLVLGWTAGCSGGGITGGAASRSDRAATSATADGGVSAAPIGQAACTATLKAGSDISAAIMGASPGAVLCLAAGIHRVFNENRPPAGVTVVGAGIGQTIFPVSGRNGIGIRNAERFTLSGVSIRNGTADAIYAANAKDLRLSDLSVEQPGTGIHIDDRSTAVLEDLTVSDSRGFGLLLRRLSDVTATRVHVRDSGGIGVGAVDGVGSVSLLDSEITTTTLPAKAESMVSIGADRLALTNVTIHGGSPAGLYTGRTPDVELRGVRVESAHFGLHLDDGSTARLEDVTLTGSEEVGLLVRQGATVTGANVRVVDNAGTGVSAIAKPGTVTLNDSEIGPANGPGLFMGAAGCADLPPASLEVPACFTDNPTAFIADGQVTLERVTLHDTAGPCLVFFPGAHAEVRDSTLTRCNLTGLFAWGAEANVAGTTFDDNAEHALEYRAYPDPRRDILRDASGTISDSVIRNTRPLEGAILGAAGPGPVLGGGILAQRSRLDVRDTEVSGNHAIGVSYVNGSSGEVAGNRITGNGGSGICLVTGTRVTVHDNVVAGNQSDDLNACGGYVAARP